MVKNNKFLSRSIVQRWKQGWSWLVLLHPNSQSFDSNRRTLKRNKKNALLGSSFFFWFRRNPSPTSQAITIHHLSLFSLLFTSFFTISFCFIRIIASGHSAVNIGKSKVVVFGGLVDKKFLSDMAVYDIGNGTLFLVFSVFH